MTSRARGYSLVELLVALAIFGIVASVLVNVFSGSLRFTRAQQAREELRSNVQAALELITEDVRLSGSYGVPSYGNTIDPNTALLTADGGASADGLRIRYARYNYATSTVPSSYTLTDVTYRVGVDAQGRETLFRSAVPAGTAGCPLTGAVAAGGGCEPAVSGIVALNVRYYLRFDCLHGVNGSVIYREAVVDRIAPGDYVSHADCSEPSYPVGPADVYRAQVVAVGRTVLPQTDASGSIAAGAQTIAKQDGFIYHQLTGVADTPSL